jgi:hypothetical protein
MIVNDIKPTLETSAEMKATSFSIGDLAVIFGILRSKMYSAPITAICREISSNALDANVEAGKPNEPIQITLPNAIEPVLKIKDSGLGISPDRVEDIYVRYGSSTKRNTNDQIGAFGTGSKSPFSYSTCWQVETIHKSIKYCYSAVIDSTNVGQLLKLSETPTDESDGTTISIPIKPQDFRAFADAVEQITRHFDPKPIIKGGKITYQTPNWILEGSNWKIASSSGYSRQPRLLVGCIEYPLDLSQIPDASDLRIFYDVQGDPYLQFGIGELSLSASREAIHLDKPTIDKIVARAKEAYAKLHATFQTKIADCPTLKEAYIAYTQLTRTISSLPKMEWNGIELSTSLYVPHMYEWSKGLPSPYNPSYLRFDSNGSYPLYINDLQNKQLSKQQVAKLFDIKDDEGKTHSRINIVNASTPDNWEENLEKKVASLHLEELGAIFLSEVISLDPEKPVVPRMTVFKFNPMNSKFGRVKYADFKADKSTKVLCSLYKGWGGVRHARYKSGNLTPKQMGYVFDDSSVSFYGLDETVKANKTTKFFPGCKSLDDYISGRVMPHDEILKVKAISRVVNDVEQGQWHSFFTAAKDDDTRLNESVKRIVEAHKAQTELVFGRQNEVSGYEAIMGYINGDDVNDWLEKNKSEWIDCNQALDDAFKRYPLLSMVGYYGWSQSWADIVEYMRLIDERDAKKTNKTAKERGSWK